MAAGGKERRYCRRYRVAAGVASWSRADWFHVGGAGVPTFRTVKVTIHARPSPMWPQNYHTHTPNVKRKKLQNVRVTGASPRRGFCGARQRGRSAPALLLYSRQEQAAEAPSVALISKAVLDDTYLCPLQPHSSLSPFQPSFAPFSTSRRSMRRSTASHPFQSPLPFCALPIPLLNHPRFRFAAQIRELGDARN